MIIMMIIARIPDVENGALKKTTTHAYKSKFI